MIGKSKKNQPVQETEIQDDVQQDERITELQAQLDLARQSELRAMADYTNLVRRTQEERIKLVKLAGLSVIEAVLQPLDHLALAQAQLQDKGLQMVYQQFVQALAAEGVEVMSVLGLPFDATTMEVISKQPVTKQEDHGKVMQVSQAGYRLHGEVIRHAKVIVGEWQQHTI